MPRMDKPWSHEGARWPADVIEHLLPFLDGVALAGWRPCSRRYRERAAVHAGLGLARISTLRLGDPAVAPWGSVSRLFAVLTCPPDLRRLADPKNVAWKPIAAHIDLRTRCDLQGGAWFAKTTDYARRDHRACMIKYALRFGDAAVIEGVLRTMLTMRNGEKREARMTWFDRRMKQSRGDNPISEEVLHIHFLRVEREQAAAAGDDLDEPRVPLEALGCATHRRCFPGLASPDVLADVAGWASNRSQVGLLRLAYDMGARLDRGGGRTTGAIRQAKTSGPYEFLRSVGIDDIEPPPIPLDFSLH